MSNLPDFPLHLLPLAEKPNMSVQVREADFDLFPASSLPGFESARDKWSERVLQGVVTNGVTLAPTMVATRENGITMVVRREDYVTVRASCELWQALSDEERTAGMQSPGYAPGYSRFLGTACAVIGADGDMVLARRSMRTATEPGLWGPAIGEGMDESDLANGQADVMGCIRRGAMEELGLELSDADWARCLSVGNVTFNTKSAEIVFNAVVDLSLARDVTLTATQVIEHARENARDAWERDRYVAISCTLDGLEDFAQTSGVNLSGYATVTARAALTARLSRDMDIAADSLEVTPSFMSR